MATKKAQIKNFIHKLSEYNSCQNIRRGNKDLSLINDFYKPKFFNNFPDIWFDWERRADAKLMIIGQDWGPYSAMVNIKEHYLEELSKDNESNETVRKSFVNNPKDRTTKKLKTCLLESANRTNTPISENYTDNMFLTVAVFYARQGNHFRGNHNFTDKESAERCLPLLEEQIEIIKPKVIMTLGGLALESIASLANFKLEKNLTNSIEAINKSQGSFKYKDIIVIPNFHPAAHVPKESYMNQYDMLWKYISI